MGLYDRDYARGNSTTTYNDTNFNDSNIVVFVKKTYQLFALSMITAAIGIYVGMPYASTIAEYYWYLAIPILLFGFFGLGIVRHIPVVNMISMFVFTFATGLIITPLFANILQLKGGAEIIGNAFIMTAVLFAGLSFFAIKTSMDFGSLRKPLFIALVVFIALSLVNVLFLGNPIVYVLLEGVILVVVSGMVLSDTQNIISGAYATPIEGAVSLYINFFNMFVTLLQLFGIFGSDD
jgi:modulator of FtsH protease